MRVEQLQGWMCRDEENERGETRKGQSVQRPMMQPSTKRPAVDRAWFGQPHPDLARKGKRERKKKGKEKGKRVKGRERKERKKR